MPQTARGDDMPDTTKDLLERVLLVVGTIYEGIQKEEIEIAMKAIF